MSCTKDEENIPSYIKINEINLEDHQHTKNITDAWVYINDEIQGVYELPAQFPIINNGELEVRIKGGIKINGISSTRIAYPFYSSYIETKTLSANQITTINPTLNYLDSANIINEIELDIDSNNNSSISMTNLYENDTIKYSFGALIDSTLALELSSKEIENLPKSGAPVFLELDYKCNTEFLVGMYANNPQSVERKDLLLVNPKDEWNKIYINLTPIVSESINATSLSIFIRMEREFNITSNELSIKNIKLVYSN